MQGAVIIVPPPALIFSSMFYKSVSHWHLADQKGIPYIFSAISQKHLLSTYQVYRCAQHRECSHEPDPALLCENYGLSGKDILV